MKRKQPLAAGTVTPPAPPVFDDDAAWTWLFIPDRSPLLRHGIRLSLIKMLRNPDSPVQAWQRTLIADYLEEIPEPKQGEASRQDQERLSRDLQIAFNTRAIMNDWRDKKRPSSPDDEYRAAAVAAKEVHERREAFVENLNTGRKRPRLGDTQASAVYKEFRWLVELYEEIAGEVTGPLSRSQVHAACKLVFETPNVEFRFSLPYII